MTNSTLSYGPGEPAFISTSEQSGFRCGNFVFRMLVQHKHAVGWKIVVAGKGVAREKIVHRFVKLDADGRVLVVEQKENARALLFPHTDLDAFGNLEQRMEAAHLAQPHNEVVVKMLVAHRADVNGFAEAEGIDRDGGAAGVKVLHIRRQNLAALRFDEVAPDFGRMNMARRERTLEREM